MFRFDSRQIQVIDSPDVGEIIDSGNLKEQSCDKDC